MTLVHSADELRSSRPVCAAIGFFDGVHLGHQHIIRHMVNTARPADALAVAITFDRHPASVVAPHRTPLLIQTLSQKLRAIAGLGVDATLLLSFTEAFSHIAGEQFVRDLADRLGRLKSICVGKAFHFGYQRSGNLALLETLGNELHFDVYGAQPVSFEGEAISSTRIREAICHGDLDTAVGMMGRDYALMGPVVHGDHFGRQLGFPTANLDTPGLVLPPRGVYAVRARLDQAVHPAVLNIGLRPTLANPEPQLQVEAHLLDFSGDLYGQELELILDRRLRDEQKFPSLEALQAQIAQDIKAARGE